MAIIAAKASRAGGLFAPVLFLLLADAVWVAAQRTDLEKPLFLLLVIQVVLFVLLVRRPVWAVAALVVGQLTSSSYMVGIGTASVSARFLWTVLSLTILVPFLAQRAFYTDRPSRLIMLPAFGLFVLSTLANWTNTNTPYTLVYLRQTLSALAILVIVPAAIVSRKDLRVLAWTTVLTAAASAVAAVMQHYTFKGLPALTISPDAFWPGRVPGLTESPVHLAYVLPIALLFVLACCLVGGLGKQAKTALAFIALVMAAALFFTFTRSGILAVGIGVLVVALLLKGRVRWEMLLVLLVLAASFWYYSDARGSRYTDESEGSAVSRIVFWQAGLAIAWDHPLMGIGHDQFAGESVGYVSAVSSRYVDVAGKALGKYQPHNDFLNILVSFGSPALLSFVALLLGVLFNYVQGYRRAQDSLVRGVSLGGVGALIAYVVNAATHNLMDGVFILWVLAGLSIAVVRLSQCPADSVERQG